MLQFYHNLPLLIRVHTTLLASMCHAMPFWTRALKEKKTFSLTFIPGKNKPNVISWSVLYRQWVRFITLFSNNVFLLLLHVERVCKSFWKESWRVQVAHCIMQHVQFQVGVGVFNCQQVLTKISFVIMILWYKTNRIWLSVVCILIDNDTGHHTRQDLLWNHWFIHACRHK